MAHRRRARAALRSHYRGAGGGIYNRQIVWLTMSETGTEIATAARASALDRRTLWAGGGALIIVIAAAFGCRSSLVPEPLMEMLTYASSPFLLDGALTAVEIAALAMTGGVMLGLVLALMRLSTLPPLQGTAWLYIWFIRGTPLILQLVFLYDALPVVGIKLDSFTTAVVGFMPNQPPFTPNIIPPPILSLDRNQTPPTP